MQIFNEKRYLPYRIPLFPPSLFSAVNVQLITLIFIKVLIFQIVYDRFPLIAICIQGPVAQWLERRTHNPLVAGSSPAGPISIHHSGYNPNTRSRIKDSCSYFLL